MAMNKYLKWLSETATYWWNDDADMDTMDIAIDNGSTGVTTNPLLVKKSLYAHPDYWRPYIAGAKGLTGDAKAEEIIRGVTVQIAKKYQPIYDRSDGVQGYVCAQVNPKKQGDTAEMVEISFKTCSVGSQYCR
jgi:transaldolase